MVIDPPPSDNVANPEKANRPANPFFGMVLFSSAIFVMTILAMVAVIFSDPDAPITRFLDAHGGRLIIAEVIVTLVVGLLALVVDRVQSLRKKSSQQPPENSSNA